MSNSERKDEQAGCGLVEMDCAMHPNTTPPQVEATGAQSTGVC
jgi:hypothetical protein